MSSMIHRAAFVVCALTPALTYAQAPWQVALQTTMDPLPVGACAQIRLTLFDPATKGVPRSGSGRLIQMADFDIVVTTADGVSATEHYLDAYNVSACGCQGAAPGTVATVTATYPAKGAAPGAQAPFSKSTTFTLGRPQGTSNPPACVMRASNPNPTPSAVASAAPAAVTAPAPPPPAAPAAVVATAVAPPSAPPVAPVAAPPAPAAPVAVAAVSVVPAAAVPIEAPQTAPVPVSTGQPAPQAVGASAGRSAPVVPINPSGFKAMLTGPQQVQLEWQPVAGASYYVLLGPGIPNGGTKLTGVTYYIATAVSPGNQEWAVASYYDPGPVSTAAGLFPRASVDVPAPPAPTPPPAPVAATGRYMVTLTAVRAYQASQDDVLSRDGRGDELYAAAYIRLYDRVTGTMTGTPSVIRTKPHGDVGSFPTGRIYAGTASATGGIHDGDVIPAGAMVAHRSLPPQAETFPWKLWEGTLTDGAQALVISPSLWEADEIASDYWYWTWNQAALNASLLAKPSVQRQIAYGWFEVLLSGAVGPIDSYSGTQQRGVADIAWLPVTDKNVTQNTWARDRPLGLLNITPVELALPNRVIVLTREIIEAALTQPPRGTFHSPTVSGPGLASIGMSSPKTGVIMVPFVDKGGGPRPAVYHMFIQVERVP